MESAKRTRLAIAACLCLAWCGCAGHATKTVSAPPYNPWVTVDQVPTGEACADPPSGWERFEPVNISSTFAIWTGHGPSEQIARENYRQGDELYRKQQYHDAALKYQAAADRYPGTSIEEDALFMAGEAHFFADEYSKAEDSYASVVKKFSNTRFMSMIVFREYAIGIYWLEYDHAHPSWAVKPNFTDKTRPMFDTFGYAIREFDQVRLNDPRGKLADEAIWVTANAYFLENHFDDAAYYYQLIRTQYAKSKHQKEAHLLEIQSELHLYQGPMYDARPLKLAEDLIDQTLAQYGRELGDERARLLMDKGEIHAQYALRLWSFAQFYDKTKHYAAARIYYNQVVKDYPNTELSTRSETRLAQIAPLPDNPTDYFKWMAIVFDHEDPDKQKLIPDTDTSPTQIAQPPSDTIQR